jgi:hypothetical protein
METVAACLVHTIYVTDSFLLPHSLPQKPSLYIIMVMCWSRLSLLVIGALVASNATDSLPTSSPNLTPFSTFPTPFSTPTPFPTVATPFPTSTESPRLSPAIFPSPSAQALNPARTRISVNAPHSEPRENNQGRLGLLVLIPIVGLIGAGAWYYKRYKVAQTEATKESGTESTSAKDHPATQPSEPKEALVDETTSSHSPDPVLDQNTVEPAAAAAPQLAAYATAYLPNNKDQCQSVIGAATATPLVTAAVLLDHDPGSNLQVSPPAKFDASNEERSNVFDESDIEENHAANEFLDRTSLF